jgi:holo-[acyl-carrier protein] synthase
MTYSSRRRMTPVRIGIDLVSVDSVRESVRAYGERYLARVFSPREIADSTTAALDERRLAERLAVKEATFKALELGPRDPTVWRDVEVKRAAAGTVEVSLRGAAAELARIAGITRLAASLTHGRDSAAAIVIAEHSASDR